MIGVDALNDVGITIEDPDGPDDDVYAALTRDQLADVVVVWRACTDVPALVEKKVAAFEILKLERLILEVANRELRSIVVLGGVLGVLIGLAQVGFLWLRG